MRVIVHGGLHKSGTTSIQASWRAAYAEHSAIWYPSRSGTHPPGHHDVTRPLLTAFTEGRDPDLVAASTAWRLRGDSRNVRSLPSLIAEAEQRRAEVLLLSSEDLDRAREPDRAALAAAFGGHEVTLVLTATQPAHRWCSGWQTLVKHGLAAYPRDAEQLILDFAALHPGRLAELLSLVPATRRLVRLVRSAPPEPELAGDLARTLGLPDPDLATGHGVRNASLGTDTEVVLRINRADLALGTNKAGRRALDELRGTGFDYREDPSLAGRYALPEAFAQAARSEADWLRVTAAAQVLDPHGLLPLWAEPVLPAWYVDLGRREAILAPLESDPTRSGEDREAQLWRARQERSAYRRRLDRLDRQQQPE